jgi:predicted negative regulator of RcsB-dependent stress response
MVRDIEEQVERANNDIFDEDEEDREMRKFTIQITVVLVLFALILVGLVIGWHFYGDVIMSEMSGLFDLLDKLQNPTGFAG